MSRFIFPIIILVSLVSCTAPTDTLTMTPEPNEVTMSPDSPTYYGVLQEQCANLDEEAQREGCKASVALMSSGGYREAQRDGEDTSCPDGMVKNLLRSPGSLIWCEPETGN